jgi:hypothetical protein
MAERDYRQALEAAAREYETLLAKRGRLDRRLARLHETINALQRLCGLTPSVDWGLSDACRVVLRRADAALTPLEVREKLRAIGFDLSRYVNDLSAIHTTLKRLAQSGEAKRVTRLPGEHAYCWLRVRAMTLEQALNHVSMELTRDLGALPRERKE